MTFTTVKKLGDWQFARLKTGKDKRRYRLRRTRSMRAFVGEVETPTGWRWVGEMKPSQVKKHFNFDPPEGYFRQLVRVVKTEGSKVFVVVPGLSKITYETPRSIYPKSWRLTTLEKGLRFFCVVNMTNGRTLSRSLELLAPFEEAPAPDPDDGLGPTTNPLKVINPGIPPSLRPEEIVEASADLLEIHDFLERLISFTSGSTPLNDSAPIEKVLRRCLRLRQLLQVAEVRIQTGRAA